jgi:hypothetical protein
LGGSFYATAFIVSGLVAQFAKEQIVFVIAVYVIVGIVLLFVRREVIGRLDITYIEAVGIHFGGSSSGPYSGPLQCPSACSSGVQAHCVSDLTPSGEHMLNLF